MKPIWNFQKQEFYIEEPIGNQMLYIGFNIEEESLDTTYYNIYASVFSKRKQIPMNEELAKITGKNPLMTFLLARQAFKLLEQTCIEAESHNRNIVFYVRWVDNRRRDAYYKVLSKWGYRYGKDQDNEKCLFKKIKRGV